VSSPNKTIATLDQIENELSRRQFSPTRDLAISLVMAAKQALASANGIGEVKDVRDKLRSFEVYFKRQRAELITSNLVVAQRLRTERELGAMLKWTVRRGNPQLYGDSQLSHDVTIGKLPDGIGRKDSSRWQREAEIDNDDFEAWVQERLNSEELSTAALLRLWIETHQPDPLPKVPPPNGKYRCLVIDPPWPVSKIPREERPLQSETLDYPIMSLEDIAALPIVGLAADDGCHLYLWVTHHFLPYGLELLAAWEFNYQCVMTWIKPTGMTPFSWMYNTEHVLFAARGGQGLETMGLKLSFEEIVKGHSVKPNIFYERVLLASPEPRLEMFARQPREGFNVWGNEV